ncbi:MAG: 1-(5-phosphoribosyl)-5-[(5-phosphoribosylamino)methylideneamino] imidazole-4-carboxamide isomerase [Candidatus Altiarchaeota archaeon]
MDFRIIPAIDIMGKRCVQLVGGRPETMVDYGDPVEKGRIWKKLGAEMLHVIDLDAALGRGENMKTILNVKKATGLPIEVGGGIRSVERAEQMLDELGPEDRVILGTLALNDYTSGFSILRHLSERYGEDKVIVAVDSKDGFVSTKGWTEKSMFKATDLMKSCEEYAWGFLYTNVDVEGRMGGINVDAIKEVLNATDKPVIISGGVSGETDIEVVRGLGAWGVVLGKALYEGKISLKDIRQDGN